MSVLLRRRIRSLVSLAALLAVCLPHLACDSLYYKTMKRFGMEKRDILVKRVRDARKSQTEAKEEFQSALERFRTVIDVDGGPLEKKYDTLSKTLERSEDKARKVRERLDAVRDVSKDLFKE